MYAEFQISKGILGAFHRILTKATYLYYKLEGNKVHIDLSYF
jgi:hypothetical protein